MSRGKRRKEARLKALEDTYNVEINSVHWGWWRAERNGERIVDASTITMLEEQLEGWSRS